MLKFGRLALADALSGTSGQVVPERDLAAIDLLDPGEEPDKRGPPAGAPPTIEPGGES